MKFKYTIIALALIIGVTSNIPSFQSQGGRPSPASQATAPGKIMPVEGVHYSVIANPLKKPSNHILEYFWYGCPHCFTAEGVLDKYLKDKTQRVVVEKVHSQLSNRWRSDARFFFAFNDLANFNEIHKAYFKLRQSASFSEEDVWDIMLSNGVSRRDFLERMASINTDMALKDSYKIESGLNIKGTPTYIVGGKYLIHLENLGNWENLPLVFDYLINKNGK